MCADFHGDDMKIKTKQATVQETSTAETLQFRVTQDLVLAC